MSDRIGRREFIGKVMAGGVAAAVAGCSQRQGAGTGAPTTRAVARKPQAHDVVALGKSGAKVSRLGMGTGTVGWNHASNQTRLGMDALTKLFRHAFDQGVAYFDLADMYGSHDYLRNALKQIPRDNVTILTKTVSRNPDGVRKDLDRFRQELDTDYIDIVLLHCLTDADWTTKMTGCMDVLSEAKQAGRIKAHGCSCHTIGALRLAAVTPWVEVDLARFNPRQVKMDAAPAEVAVVLQQFHDRGAGVLGMKILGEGQLKDEASREESLRHVLSHSCVDAFCIGFEAPEQVDDIVRRIGLVAG